MPRFLIEVEHEADAVACARAIKVFLSSGSHLLTHADWGCNDGVHRAWVTVDVADKAEARGIVPPAFRAQARIIGLNGFTLEEVNAILGRHDP